MRAHDLDGIVGKRLGDPYEHSVKWQKIKLAEPVCREVPSGLVAP
jgi:hypothetical protein